MTTPTDGTATVSTPAANTILITREFRAPRHLVWKAYTEPELIKRWWAGERGTVTSAEVDLRVGGRWRYVMTANPGFEVAFHGEFRAVEPVERLVNTEIFESLPDPDEHVSVVTVTFSEKDGRTVMEMLAEYRDQADRDAVLQSGMEGGMQEGMTALEQIAISLA